MNNILSAMMPHNRLAIIVSMVTGLRISDVLSLKTEAVRKGRFSVKEQKTGKTKRVNLPKLLQEDLLAIAGRIYVFEHRLDPHRTRTRQAVWKDINRASELFRIRGLTVAPHTARKIYAVKSFKKSDLKHCKDLLNHSSEAVTIVYAMADELTARKTKGKKVYVPK